MRMEYEMPLVEFIDFIAMQKLANREAIEGRDSARGAGGEGGATDEGSFNEGVGDWPFG